MDEHSKTGADAKRYTLASGENLRFRLTAEPDKMVYVRYTGNIPGRCRLEGVVGGDARTYPSDFGDEVRGDYARINLWLGHAKYHLVLDVTKVDSSSVTFINSTPEEVGRFV